ncbi:SDR family NAD(P)-dependent oxidoreductase [Candidatus Enterococcus lemimoniae]|uniref:3-oxoacyl-ACP reductase n=1 Tax=Candidatus Enterococcus lemimoniae TaxID=1834167 RepID=A0ABZ2T3N3_9ENTE|nr:SDR family NAD(P)-dependent oxidoreductase [Enterococcus sp. 12C11_DIV0727]OTO68742.1 hypothetical protein A5866_000940 [Enterococcus sp. 12C11_DIV0727]
MVNKVVLITGGTRGIGRSLVDKFLQKQFIVASFSSNAKNVSLLRQAYPEENRLFLRTVDINNKQDSLAFVTDTIKKFGRIDYLFLNSGICEDITFSKMTDNQWEKVLSTNISSLFTLSQAVFKQMMQQSGSKKIYMMTSTAGIYGVFGQTNYSASKAAIIGFSKSLALEGKKYGIQVNAIAPAALTDMTMPVMNKIAKKYNKKNQPLPDYWQIGTSEALADTAYKLSQMHGALTGKVFGINGNQIVLYEEPSSSLFDLTP